MLRGAFLLWLEHDKSGVNVEDGSGKNTFFFFFRYEPISKRKKALRPQKADPTNLELFISVTSWVMCGF